MHAGVSTDYDYVIWGQWPDGQSMYNEWGSYTNEFWRGWPSRTSQSRWQALPPAVSQCLMLQRLTAVSLGRQGCLAAAPVGRIAH